MLLLRIGFRYPLDKACIDWVVSLIEFSNHGTPWKIRLPSTVYHTWIPPVFAMKRWRWRNRGWTVYAEQRSCNAWLQASITLWISRNHSSSNEAKTFTYKSINESCPHRDLRRLTSTKSFVSVVFLYEAPFFAVGIVTVWKRRKKRREEEWWRKEMTSIQILQCQFEQFYLHRQMRVLSFENCFKFPYSLGEVN